MGSLLNPYLSFTDNARAAMEFYQSVFGGDLTIHTFGEYGDKQAPEAALVMHAQLADTPSGFTLMGADTPPGMDRASGSSMVVCLSGDEAETLRGYWDKLSMGGTVSTPLEKQMWGDEYGACEDQFGTPWMVNIWTPQG